MNTTRRDDRGLTPNSSGCGRPAPSHALVCPSPAVWTTIAVDTGAAPAGQTFDPFHDDEVSRLSAAYVIEDVCVTARAWDASRLSLPANMMSAARLRRHRSDPGGCRTPPLSAPGQGATTDEISVRRAKLSGAADDEGTVIAGAAAAKFGFFPDRANGASQSTIGRPPLRPTELGRSPTNPVAAP